MPSHKALVTIGPSITPYPQHSEKINKHVKSLDIRSKHTHANKYLNAQGNGKQCIHLCFDSLIVVSRLI